MLFRNKIIILIILVLANTSVFAEDTIVDNNQKINQQDKYALQPIKPTTFNKKEWNYLKKKLKIKDYKPEKIIEKKDKKISKKVKKWELPTQSKLIIKWLLFVSIIGMLLFLVLQVLGINPFNKKIDKNKINIALDELEENLDTASIDPHLYEAIKNKNYKLAIRLYYLMIIQKLVLKEKITWKKYKTNKQYLYELRNKNEYQILKALTLTYEICWFGESDISETEYDKLNKDFVNFLQNIK